MLSDMGEGFPTSCFPRTSCLPPITYCLLLGGFSYLLLSAPPLAQADAAEPNYGNV